MIALVMVNRRGIKHPKMTVVLILEAIGAWLGNMVSSNLTAREIKMSKKTPLR